MNIGIGEEDTLSPLQSISIGELMKPIQSGIALDIAKNHSGVVIWDGVSTTEYGFKLMDYDKSDPHALYRLRKDLYDHLLPIVNGNEYQCCIIEDTYGGSNYDTTAKLVTLNTVIDELIFQGKLSVEEFYRWKESTWLKNLRKVYKVDKSPKAKYETQLILEYLGYDFYLRNKDIGNKQKEAIFFEDICDAAGMLFSLAAYKTSDDNKPKRITIRDMEFRLVDSIYDEHYRGEFKEEVIPEKDIEKQILQYDTGQLYYMEVNDRILGKFGVKYDLHIDKGKSAFLFFRKKR